MANLIFPILRTTDVEIVQVLKKIVTDCGVAEPKCRIDVALGYPPVEVGLNSIESEPLLSPLFNEKAALIQEMSISIDRVGSIHVKRTQQYSDELHLGLNDQGDRQKVTALLISARRHFKVFDSLGDIKRVLGAEMAEFYAKREEGLHRLEQLTQQIIQQNNDFRKQLEVQYEERVGKLEVQFQERNQLLETELQNKRTEIATKENELIEKTKELDDRGAKHARRQIRKDLKQDIASKNERFQLTQDTRRKRWPVHGLFLLLVIVSLMFAVVALWEQAYPPQGANPTFLLIRVPLSILAFAAAAVYYIRWNDQWFQKHAKEEFDLRRLDIDLDRASWLVEMALEWKEEKGTELPKELLDRLSRNLFISPDELIEEVKHPTQEALSSFLGSLASLRVQIPGFGEATLGRRGLKALQKASQEESK